MTNLRVFLLLFVFSPAIAQPTISAITGQIRTGLGIGNKPGTLYGKPIFFSADVGVTFSNRWQLTAEGGALSFRDAMYPDQRIGFWFKSYSRYEHYYGGLRLGRNLLKTSPARQLTLSGGADYLEIVSPNIRRSSGFLGGYVSDRRLKGYLNIPVQLDYSFIPFGISPRFSISGRWNFNAYHSFPTISAGIIAPVYTRRLRQ